MTPQVVTHEQKEQFRQQVRRAKDASERKQRQIDLKCQRAVLLKSLHPDSDGGVDVDEVTRNLDLNESEVLQNDAALLEMDFEEFKIFVSTLEAQLRALESGLVVASGQVPSGQGQRRQR